MRQVERSLANSDQDTRDEIGFLLIHQGFADRFFPGTSVLHTRIRYALFVPWVYQRAANHRRGSDIDAATRRLLIELTIRLKQLGGEPYDVIGGDKLGQLTSQPPDRSYWTALRSWGILLPSVDSRWKALRRLQIAARSTALDDDGGQLEERAIEVFAGLPQCPNGWNDSESPLNFKLSAKEREFRRDKLRLLNRPGEGKQSLLARVVAAGDTFPNESFNLPQELDARADSADKIALSVARDAAALAAIGRAVYGAQLEQLIAQDGGPDDHTFRKQLETHFARYGAAAAQCDLVAAEKLLPTLSLHVKDVLHETQAYVRSEKPQDFFTLRLVYQNAEVRRKSSRRARLPDTERAVQRRVEWKKNRHNTTPLHYRWKIVRQMLADLNG